MLIQISFGATADLGIVKNQLKELKEKFPEANYISCFLPRHIVKEKGFDTSIVDTIDGELGDKHTYAGEKFKDFADFMSNIEDTRITVSSTVDRLAVLDASEAKGVVREIELFTNSRLIMMYR